LPLYNQGDKGNGQLIKYNQAVAIIRYGSGAVATGLTSIDAKVWT